MRDDGNGAAGIPGDAGRSQVPPTACHVDDRMSSSWRNHGWTLIDF